ncbi:MAG: peptidoglycan editing factor PgeF [Burkholderiales bacterium]|nr:peptidoglycan editing factor PgeF [Burkholderiales bacterium]
MNHDPDWIVPEWPAPANIRALITTRSGGVSSGPYASFNLGLQAGDDPQAVTQNRAQLRRLLPQDPRWLRQAHGSVVVDADELNAPPDADASVARLPDTVCAIMIADCMPVLLCDEGGTLVAAAHAGWRGLAGGVIENTVTRLVAAGAMPDTLLAYLGPAIGPTAFEVGADVYEAFVGRDPLAAQAFTPQRSGKWLACLFTLAQLALRRAGVSRVYGGGLCTYSDSRRFFSYRRDQTTGRMAALIWRER